MLSLGTYSSEVVPFLPADLSRRMQSSMSDPQDYSSPALIYVRFWLLAARAIVRRRPEWTNSVELWQAQILISIMLQNLGHDGILLEELNVVSRFPCHLARSSATVELSDPSNAGTEVSKADIDSAIGDLCFWAHALMGQPLLQDYVAARPADPDLDQLRGPHHVDEISFADGGMYDSMYHSYKVECLQFAREAYSVVHNPDYAEVEALSVSSKPTFQKARAHLHTRSHSLFSNA